MIVYYMFKHEMNNGKHMHELEVDDSISPTWEHTRYLLEQKHKLCDVSKHTSRDFSCFSYLVGFKINAPSESDITHLPMNLGDSEFLHHKCMICISRVPMKAYHRPYTPPYFKNQCFKPQNETSQVNPDEVCPDDMPEEEKMQWTMDLVAKKANVSNVSHVSHVSHSNAYIKKPHITECFHASKLERDDFVPSHTYMCNVCHKPGHFRFKCPRLQEDEHNHVFKPIIQKMAHGIPKNKLRRAENEDEIENGMHDNYGNVWVFRPLIDNFVIKLYP